MRSMIVSAFVTLTLTLGMVFEPAYADCNARSDGLGLCPFKVGDVNVLDRCLGAPPVGSDAGKATALGNTACDAIEKLQDLQKNLGKSANALVNQARRDANDFIGVTMRGAYSPQSIATYNRVARYPQEIAHEVDAVLKHPQCGSQASLRSLKTSFDHLAQTLTGVGRIAQDVGQAISALGPVGGEALKIAQDSASLVSLSVNAGQKAKQDLDALKRAADTMQQDFRQLAALDAAGTVIAGGDLALSVGPFIGNCSGCVAVLADALTNLGAGGTATAGGAASCPESAAAFGGGCWLAAIGVPLAAISPLEGAIASVPCTAATAGAANMVDYARKIDKFTTTTIKLAQSVRGNIDNVLKAGQALASLAQTLPKEAQPTLSSMQTSLNRIVDATDQSFNIMVTKVATATAGLTNTVLTQMGQNVQTMVTCYNLYQHVAFKLGGDTVKAMAEVTAATALLVDGGKVADNVYKQAGRAVKAGEDEASARWAKLSNREKQIYEELWGVPAYQVDLAKTAGHLLTLNLQKVRGIIDDVTDLEQARLTALGASVDAVKRAFLDQDKLHIARSKFDEAGQRAAHAERLFRAAESRPELQAKTAPIFAAPLLQVDVRGAIGQQKATRVQVVR